MSDDCSGRSSATARGRGTKVWPDCAFVTRLNIFARCKSETESLSVESLIAASFRQLPKLGQHLVSGIRSQAGSGCSPRPGLFARRTAAPAYGPLTAADSGQLLAQSLHVSQTCTPSVQCFDFFIS